MNNEALKNAVLSLTRHLLTGIGGILAVYGIGASWWETASGILVSVVGIVWGVLDEYYAAKNKQENK